MSSNENEKEKVKSNIIINANKKEKSPSSLKYNKFNGLTSEEIIKKYENVLFSREKQFNELSNEINKLTQTIQNLVEKKNKSKYNNDKLKEILENNEKILKQELSNKEVAFMKLTDLEHKYDDLQIKIEDIINKQNALAETKEKEVNDENKKLKDKSPQKINEGKENNYIKKEEKKEKKEIKDEIKDEINIEEEGDNLNKINIIKKEKKNIFIN